LRQIKILLYVAVLILLFTAGTVLAKETQRLKVFFTGDLKGWIAPVPK
jgi:ABC-type molybdate transport system substrate-binding protein